MYCTNCGAQVPEGHKYCEKCGAVIDPAAVNVNMAQPVYTGMPVSAPAPKRAKTWPIVLIAFLGLCVLVGSGVFTVLKVRDLFFNRKSARAPYIQEPYEDGFQFNYGYSFDSDDEHPFDFDYDYSFGDFDPDEYFEDYMDEFDFYDDYGDDYSDDYTYNEYSYANTVSYDDCMYLEGRKTIKDSTVIYGDKTIGGFCDFVDRQVLEDGRKLDRQLLYSLLEVHLVDSSFYEGTDNEDYFRQTMMYCLLFANEFSDMDLLLENCMYYYDEPTTYYYDVKIDNKPDTWTVDYNKQTIWMNYGDTIYKSAGDFSMFDEKSKQGWIYVIDKYFEIK